MSPPRRPDASGWMAARGWSPFPFQREVWDAMAHGESGLLHATTGAGKTYAVWLGLVDRLRADLPADLPADRAPALSVLWITPMRALAADSAAALRTPLADLAPGQWRWLSEADLQSISASSLAKV